MEILQNEIGGHVAGIGDMKCRYSVLVGKREGKRPRGRPRRRLGGGGDIEIELQ